MVKTLTSFKSKLAARVELKENWSQGIWSLIPVLPETSDKLFHLQTGKSNHLSLLSLGGVMSYKALTRKHLSIRSSTGKNCDC